MVIWDTGDSKKCANIPLSFILFEKFLSRSENALILSTEVTITVFVTSSEATLFVLVMGSTIFAYFQQSFIFLIYFVILKVLLGFVMMLTQSNYQKHFCFYLNTKYKKFEKPRTNLFQEYIQCICFCIHYKFNISPDLSFQMYQCKDNWTLFTNTCDKNRWIHQKTNHIRWPLYENFLLV